MYISLPFCIIAQISDETIGTLYFISPSSPASHIARCNRGDTPVVRSDSRKPIVGLSGCMMPKWNDNASFFLKFRSGILPRFFSILRIYFLGCGKVDTAALEHCVPPSFPQPQRLRRTLLLHRQVHPAGLPVFVDLHHDSAGQTQTSRLVREDTHHLGDKIYSLLSITTYGCQTVGFTTGCLKSWLP